jgi:hypothetical protein
MTELDQVWAQMLSDATRNAEAGGRSDVADYLRLRATNDAVRGAAVKWLIDSAVEIEEPYRFQHGRSRLVGTAVHMEHGVRCLTVEAGWTRTPGDGIMRGGALAFARLRHRGLARLDTVLALTKGEVLPAWRLGEGEDFADSSYLKRHIETLLELR